MKQVFNPYLPLWEHVPDGEPHVFGDRVYIYGSHDRTHGVTFCMEDYVCWSAPVEDLSDWRCEGVIWRKKDDPENHDPVGYLYAPDVAQGPDGRYYLYYFFTGSNKRKPTIRVAVCDTPAGNYAFYGEVKLKRDKRFLFFDPAIFVDDDKRIWFYYGSAFQGPQDMLTVKGGAVAELAPDMLTPISEPKLTVPNVSHQKGTGFEGHAFFEASSMRKINGKYYFIYSSMLSHELCYAVADRPDGPFIYGGTILSNGDIGLNGNKMPVYPTGNNHGSLVEIGGQWYVFYHRQTQGTAFSRQGCAERVSILPDGTIPQVAITSCGLSGKQLKAVGSYPAAICCHLTGKSKPVVQEEEESGEKISFVQGLHSGDTVGWKTFAFTGQHRLCVTWRASMSGVGMMKAMNPAWMKTPGKLEILSAPDGEVLGSILIPGHTGDWETAEGTFALSGDHALYLRYRGKGGIDLKEIAFV